MKETLFELCRLVGIGGYEHMVREWIMEQAAPYADEMKVDKMGNLLIYREGRVHLKNPLALFAHMDEPGFMVKKVMDDGMIQLINNTMPAKAIIGKQLAVHGQQGVVYGVAGMKADHLQTPEEQKKTPKLSRLLMDIGCRSKAASQQVVRPGNVVVPLVEPELLGGPGSTMMTGRGLAGRGGCAVLLQLLQEKPACDCWFVFAANGENWHLVPGKGAMLAARQLNPKLAVVLSGADTGEGPGIPDEKVNCRCGQGAAFSLQDGDFVFDRWLRREVTDTIDREDELDIPWQYNMGKSQVTGAGRLASSGESCRVLPVNLPIRYMNSEAGVCCISDLESMAEVCCVMMEKAGELL